MSKLEKELYDYNESLLDFNKHLLGQLKKLNAKYEDVLAELKGYQIIDTLQDRLDKAIADKNSRFN